MPSSNKIYKPPQSLEARIYTTEGVPILPNDWTFVPFVVEFRGDTEDFYPDKPPAEHIYLFLLNPFLEDETGDWAAAIPYSFLQYNRYAGGDRHFSVATLEYDRSAPEDEWDDEDYGKFVGWKANFSVHSVRASQDSQTIVSAPARAALVSSAWGLSKPTNFLYLALRAYQTSDETVNVLNSEISLIFTKTTKREVPKNG